MELKKGEGGVSKIIYVDTNDFDEVHTFDGIFKYILKQKDEEPKKTEDADFEIIEPKRIENERNENAPGKH